MGERNRSYSFGPVPSRRLGKSLGINNIPAKACTYACVYCQAGRTTQMQTARSAFYRPEDILREVRERLQRAKSSSEPVDYLTFVPDGEPTLDVNLGREIELLKEMGIPVGVITNGSLLWSEEVREELGRVDWISVKIDSVQEPVWRKINRPHKGLRLSHILDGMRVFSSEFSGRLVTETMLVAGINDGDRCLQGVADFVHSLHPSCSYLSIPTRPPARDWVRGTDAEGLARAYERFSSGGERVEFLVDYEGDAFVSTGDISADLLSITAVHPMREEAIQALLSRSGASWEIVDRLVERGDLMKTAFGGHLYFLRRFTR